MEAAPGRVARERLEVERLGDAALTGERGVAMDEDRERDARVVVALPRGAIGLLRPRPPLDDRVDRLEVARVGDESDRDVTGRRRPRPLRAEVVLDIAASSLLARDDSLDRALAFELTQDRLVRPPDDVREDVQPAAMRHPQHDLVSAVPRSELDRLVEHRNHHVETFDGELLLPEERAPQVALHPFDLAQAPEQTYPLVGGERASVAPRLDRLPQPDALLVVRDVLDLVRNRPRVRLPQVRQSVCERLALDVQAEQRGGDEGLQLRRQLGDQTLGLESRIAGRLRTEWVEVSREVPVHPKRLDERHRGSDRAEELLVLLRDRRSRNSRRGLWRRSGRRGVPVPSGGGELEQACEAGLPLQEQLRLALEEVAPFLRHGAGVVEVLLEEQRGVPRVQPVNVGTFHVYVRCSSAASLPQRLVQGHRDRHPEEEADTADENRRELEPALAVSHARRDERNRERRQDQAQRMPGEPDEAHEDRDRGEEAGDRLRRPLLPALVEDLAFGVHRSAILAARAAAARAVRA